MEIANPIIDAVIQRIKDVKELDENLQLLNTDFERIEAFLRHIDNRFQEQQRRMPETVELCSKRMMEALDQAKPLVDRTKRQRQQFLGLLRAPGLPTEVRNWKIRFDQLFEDLQKDFSITANTEHIASTSAPQAEILLQDAPDDIVGSTIQSAQMKLQDWLTEPGHCQARVIGIWGMGGVGKTSVLKVIHNKEKVSGNFDVVIWFTVSQYMNEKEEDKVKELQDCIGYTLNLDLKDCPTLDMRKMKLSASLEKKRFLLILDDVWRFIDLNKVGVKFGNDKGSKVLISSRSGEVIRTMGASNYSLKMEPLSPEDGWDLFRRKAFAREPALEKDIETIARKIASECKGLPLALNVVAAALSSERDLNKWHQALDFMRNVDPSFQDTHNTIDAELYQRLRWSYNDLPDPVKTCFLYCAAFPEDAEIDVETLVEMWSAEGLVRRRRITYLMDVGRPYINLLIDRCLIEYVGLKRTMIPCGEHLCLVLRREVIKVHDVVRDVAIYIGQRDENWAFAAGQHLQIFPREEVNRNCKRVSVGHNDIEELPTDLECTELVSLVLANNQKLTKLPAPSLLNMVSLKALDLSCTLITSLPPSVGKLGQLEFLNLIGCYLLKELPESICTLSRLQFLNLQCCQSLISLPDKIGELRSLKHLNFALASDGDSSTVVIPRGIFGLTSLTKLCLPYVRSGCAMSMADLSNLSNLMELEILVKPDTTSNCHCRWLEMRKLTLEYDHADGDKDDVADILPFNMESMNKLQSFCLRDYNGASLPNYICKLQNLETLMLARCHKLRELPALEIGSDSARDIFPMLKRLGMSRLESVTTLNEATMPKLQSLDISGCPLLKRLSIENLYNLREIYGYRDEWLNIIGDDERDIVKFENLYKGSLFF